MRSLRMRSYGTDRVLSDLPRHISNASILLVWALQLSGQPAGADDLVPHLTWLTLIADLSSLVPHAQ